MENMKNLRMKISFVFAAVLATGCVSETLRVEKQGPTLHAQADLIAKSKSKVSGRATFIEEKGQLSLTIEVRGLPKNSLHGFHIHEKGDCSSADAASAGGHYNPHAQAHGGPAGGIRHVGDLGNLLSDGTGKVQKLLVLPGASLQGSESIANRSLVIHEKADDLSSQPAGNSGARIACGVIKLQ